MTLKRAIQLKLKIFEWIVDFTGLISVIYELDAGFDYDDFGRDRPVGAAEFLKR